MNVETSAELADKTDHLYFNHADEVKHLFLDGGSINYNFLLCTKKKL